MADDQGGKAPGTLTPDEVKNELRDFKNKLLNMPSAVAGMARDVVGKQPAAGQPNAQQPEQPAQPVQQQAAPADAAMAPTMFAQPQGHEEELYARLASIESRLSTMEHMLAELRVHLIKDE